MATSYKDALLEFREVECVRWFRGMSDDQLEACNKLLYALRDDIEQASTYRVRHCLGQLGLHPLITSKETKKIMSISHGSDLAFLWFIWEAYYKSASKDHENPNYTLNEQLLLSAIAHLDLPSTVKELDRILPPPSHSKKYQDAEHKRYESHKLREGAVRRYLKRSQMQAPQYKLPYFAPLVRPKAPLTRVPLEPPQRILRAPVYSCLDNMHQIPNEYTRWFEHYQLSPAKRVVKKILKQEINRLFLHSSLVAMNDAEQAALCATHRNQVASVEQKQQELAHEALQHCLSLLDVPYTEKKLRQKRIVRNLELEINKAASSLRRFTTRQLTRVINLRGSAGLCQLCTKLTVAPQIRPASKANLSILMRLDDKQPTKLLETIADPLIKVMQLSGSGDAPTKVIYLNEDCQQLAEESKTRLVKRRRRKKNRGSRSSSRSSNKKINKKPSTTKIRRNLQLTSRTKLFTNKKDTLPPYCHRIKIPCSAVKSPATMPETFISKSWPNTLQLDFFKVFNFSNPTTVEVDDADSIFKIEDKKATIEKCCRQALDQNLESPVEGQTPKEMGINEPFYPTVLDATNNCVFKMINQSLRQPQSEPIVKHPCKTSPEQLMKIQRIDPENTEQIAKLLETALKIMKTNPHYVLASFPNAHKLPVLLEWVASRYGKTYTSQEMTKMVKSSYHVYESLKRKQQITSPLDLKPNGNSMPRVGIIHECYVKKINQLALEESRLIWLAIRGYSHLGGSIENTFYAFMPSRETDLKRYNPWNSADYRDMVKLRRR